MITDPADQTLGQIIDAAHNGARALTRDGNTADAAILRSLAELISDQRRALRSLTAAAGHR